MRLVEVSVLLGECQLEAMIVKNQVSGAIAGTLARANPPAEKEKEDTKAAGSQRTKRQSA